MATLYEGRYFQKCNHEVKAAPKTYNPHEYVPDLLYVSLVSSFLQQTAVERAREYRELSKRIEREKQLHIVSQKMQVKKQLMVSLCFIILLESMSQVLLSIWGGVGSQRRRKSQQGKPSRNRVYFN